MGILGEEPAWALSEAQETACCGAREQVSKAGAQCVEVGTRQGLLMVKGPGKQGLTC